VRTSATIKGLIELSLFLDLKGSKSSSLPLGFKGLIQALYYLIKPFLRLRFWRIKGSNTAPYYFGLEGVDSSTSLYNYGLIISSYAPVSYYMKVLKDNY
jgi:hypothetical protein